MGVPKMSELDPSLDPVGHFGPPPLAAILDFAAGERVSPLPLDLYFSFIKRSVWVGKDHYCRNRPLHDMCMLP